MSSFSETVIGDGGETSQLVHRRFKEVSNSAEYAKKICQTGTENALGESRRIDTRIR